MPGVAPMRENFLRLVVAHGVLALASGFAYWSRPGALGSRVHMPRRAYALFLILQTFVAYAPYIISGVYSCSLLLARERKATLAFIGYAVGAGIIADCLYLNLLGVNAPPLLVSVVLTIALIAAARFCSARWRNDVSQWDGFD
jgi:hypothetical protein